MTRSLDSHCDGSLMLSTASGDPAGKDLSALGYESLKLCCILVIDLAFGISTECADLFPSANAHRTPSALRIALIIS